MSHGVGLESQALNSRLRSLCAGFLSLVLWHGVWAKELRIVTIESAPFGFVGKDGKPTGMMFEIGNLIATEAGFTYTNQITP